MAYDPDVGFYNDSLRSFADVVREIDAMTTPPTGPQEDATMPERPNPDVLAMTRPERDPIQRTPVIAVQGHDGRPVVIVSGRHIDMTEDVAPLACPHCGAGWPEHLQHEHDMLEVTTFRTEPDGTIGAYSDDPTYLDNNAWFCTACLRNVTAHVGEELLDRLEAAMEESSR